MRLRPILLSTALALGAVAVGLPAPGTTGAALAEDARVERARSLVQEAEPWVEQAGNMTLENSDRKAARREAHERLKEARDLYNAVCDDQPSLIESLDSEMTRCNQSLFWIRKMASANEFSGGAPKRELPPPKPRKEPVDPPPPPRGEGGVEHPVPGAGPTKDPEPKPPPEPTQAEMATDVFASIQEYEKSHPYDVEGVVELYEQFLAKFDDPALPEFSLVSQRLADLNDELRAFFKARIGDDPDSVEQADSREVAQVIARLSREMRSGEADVRVRAAKLLGNLRSGEGSFPLVKGLFDGDASVEKQCFESLVAIGGARMAYNLTKQYQGKRSVELTMPALEVLKQVGAKGVGDARVVSPFIGRFVLSNVDETAEAAYDALIAMGKPGAVGLMEALETRNPTKERLLIEALGDIKHYPSADRLCEYMLRGDNPKTVMLRNAAAEALKKMGTRAMPYMLEHIPNGRTGAWTRVVMRDIVGFPVGPKDIKQMREWCAENVPSGSEE